MPISDPSKILFSTSYKYFLNYDSKSGSVSIPSTSYSMNEAKSYTVTLPLTRTNDFSQVQVNFSFDASKWYVFPFGEIVLDLAFGSVKTLARYVGGNLVVTFYVVNQVGAPANNPAFTATVRGLLFVTPT